jgi:hypothetical protein
MFLHSITIDGILPPRDNNHMNEKPFSTIPPELRAEFDEAVRRAMSGHRDSEAMKKACDHMDGVREQIRRQFGVQDIGVNLIRELRGELPEL